MPFVSGTVQIPYEIVPQVYLLTELLLGFLFEAPITIRPFIDFFWIWLFIRYFMRTHRGS